MYCVLCTLCIVLIPLIAFFASYIFDKSDSNGVNHQYDVILMGAGISSLAAATELYNNGITNILIVEAQDYVGGRIKTVEIDGESLNSGATHVNGACIQCMNKPSNNIINPILKLLNKYNMKYIKDQTNQIPFNVVCDEKRNNMSEIYGNQDFYVNDDLGYNGINLYLAGELIENGIDIKLNEAINTIFHDNNHIIAKTDKNNKYYAKYGINTFSFGVLQNNFVEFSPSLPSWKLNVIKNQKMEHYTTIYIKWSNYIWFNNQTKSNKLFVIESKSKETSSEYTLYVNNLNKSKYFSGSNIWKIDIIHPFVKSIEENIYEFVYQQILNYFDYVPDVIDVVITDWNNNKYTQGVYSINSNNSAKDWKQIKSRVNNIFFCGDGTSITQYGYASGAYFEGINTAKQVISCLKNEFDSKCPIEYYDRNKNGYGFTFGYQFYFSWWIRFVVIRFLVLLYFCILIIKKLLYMIKSTY